MSISILALLIYPASSWAAERIRFAYPAKSLNMLPVFLGKEKGIYLGEGIDLEPIQVGSAIQITALMTGDIHFAGAQASVITAAAKGLPVKVVAFITVKPSFWLVAKPEILSIADLRGKIIGISTVGAATDTLTRYLLKKYGLVPDREVALLATGSTANILTALKGGSVDAGILSPPFHAIATKHLGLRILVYLGDHVEQSLSGIGASEQLLREKADLVKKVLRATLKALDFVRRNREDTVQYIMKEWKVDRPLGEELYLSMLPAFSQDGSMGEKGIRETVDRERERMGIRREIAVTRVVDLRLLRELRKE